MRHQSADKAVHKDSEGERDAGLVQTNLKRLSLS